MEAAKDLGRDPGELLGDLHRLACCGVGPWPDELVDLSADYRQVTISNSQGMDHALRLTPTEAGALLLTLESLETTPGLIDQEAVLSAASKLRKILDPEAVAIYDSLATEDPAESASQVILREAMEADKKVRFTYHSASSDSASIRTVDPARIFVNGGETYLVAWEESSGQHKNFRADRMSNMVILEEQAQPHLNEMPFDAADPFSFGTIAEHAELLIRADATWLADYHPITLGEDLGDGWVSARMPVGSREWFIRFVIGQADRLFITGPPEMVEEIALRVQSGLRAYTQSLE